MQQVWQGLKHTDGTAYEHDSGSRGATHLSSRGGGRVAGACTVLRYLFLLLLIEMCNVIEVYGF